ncbi:MAG: H-NS histone family protein [Proteobacteria bacterium]|nr:H-NS histone family protein [Pseudomonadota bacterium]
MDLSKFSSKELQSLLRRIAVEIKGRAKHEKSKLLKEIAHLATNRGYSLKELFGKTARPFKSSPAKSKKVSTRKPVSVKYRHPQDPNLTWTGRGRKPHWVTEWLAKGKMMESLVV